MEKDVIPTHRAILTLLEQLTETQTKLYSKYREYLEKNKVLQVFGLDTFLYQCRLLDLELKQAHEHYSFLNNRMYCDYYKLYHVVRIFMKESFQFEPRNRSYPIYKDLEPYKVYETMDILLLYEDLSEMLRKAVGEISRKEKDLTKDIQEKGIRLEHFIHHRTSNHALLTTKIELYEKYLRSYHIYHMSFLSNLLERLQLLFRQTESPTDPKGYPPEPMSKYLPADATEASTQTDEVLVEKEPMEEPTEKPDEKPAEKLTDKPVEKPTEKLADKSTDKLADKPAESKEEPIESTEEANQHKEEPLEELVEDLVEDLVEALPEDFMEVVSAKDPELMSEHIEHLLETITPFIEPESPLQSSISETSLESSSLESSPLENSILENTILEPLSKKKKKKFKK